MPSIISENHYAISKTILAQENMNLLEHRNNFFRLFNVFRKVGIHRADFVGYRIFPFSMNINKCHVNSDVQTRDKAFDMIFRMIRQNIAVLRQNVSLLQRHLSNRYFKLQNAYSCVIKIWM